MTFKLKNSIAIDVPKRARERSGFALVYILLVAGVLAMGTSALFSSMRALGNEAQAQFEDVRKRLTFEAATTRTLFAFRASTDPLRQFFERSKNPQLWKFAEIEVWLSMRPEGGRIDLNAASPQLLQALFAGIARSPETAERWLTTVLQMRADGVTIRSPADILDACEFLAVSGSALRSATTVWTGSRTVDPRWIEPDLAKLLIANDGSELGTSLANAVVSPNNFSADRYVDVNRSTMRLEVVRAGTADPQYRLSTILAFTEQGQILRPVAWEAVYRSAIDARCD